MVLREKQPANIKGASLNTAEKAAGSVMDVRDLQFWNMLAVVVMLPQVAGRLTEVRESQVTNMLEVVVMLPQDAGRVMACSE